MQQMEGKASSQGCDSEDMGEGTLRQRVQLEEMVLKYKNDGKEMESDTGLQAGMLNSHVFFLCPFTWFVHEPYSKSK